MKLFLIATLISSSAAFAPAPPAGRQSVALQSSSANAIEAALAASKKYGPTSKEAAVLWDIVEEMDASDNRCVERSLRMKVSIRGYANFFFIMSTLLCSNSHLMHQNIYCNKNTQRGIQTRRRRR